MRGSLFILSGPSGVGKDTVLDAWMDADPLVKRVVSYTTRAPRNAEQNGIDYHFVSPERFHELANAGAFLEYKEVHGNWYATPLSDLNAMRDQGLTAVLKIDVQGALVAMEKCPDAITVFLLPPSRDELMRRLMSRGTEDAAALERRIQNAEFELAHAHHYRHQLVNEEIQDVVRQLQALKAQAGGA